MKANYSNSQSGHPPEQDTSIVIPLPNSTEDHNSKNSEPKKDSHSDDHHDHSNCQGHDHKPRRVQRYYNTRALKIQFFLYGTMIASYILGSFWLSEALEGYPFDKFANQAFATFLVVMSLISYYKCTNIQNKNPSQYVPFSASPQNIEVCKKCKHWKPERTHHCSRCGVCNLKMDHHCPWLVNCVGYKNHKAFLLFCLYVTVGSSYYVYRSIYFLIYKIREGSLFKLGLYFGIIWPAVTITVASFGVMVAYLAAYHIWFAVNDITTLESMGGGTMRNPFLSKRIQEERPMNKYDRGILVNLYDFFGNTCVWWWWPTTPKYDYTGQRFDQIVQPTQIEIIDYVSGKTDELSQREKMMRPRNIGDIDIEKLFKLAEEITKDKDLRFFDKMIEANKRNETSPKNLGELTDNLQREDLQGQERLNENGKNKAIEEKDNVNKDENH